jgi:hypothetical protein
MFDLNWMMSVLRAKSGGQPPQSRRFAPHDKFRQSRSVWTAVALAPLLRAAK